MQRPGGHPLGGITNLGPTQRVRFAELEGPGVITHFWCTIAHDAPFYSRLLTSPLR